MRGAKQTLERFNKEHEGSSEHALAIKQSNFQVPPVFAPQKSVRSQIKEIYGKAEYYHNAEYQTLLGKLVPLRKEFPRTKEVGARKEMAKEEFNLWHGYLEARKEVLPNPDYHIDDKDLSQLKETFDRFKDRKTYAVKSEELVDFHHDFAKKFRFRVPLHPKNMQQMIHPHFGYLCNFSEKNFSFDDLLQVYKNQIVSSYERSLG